MSSSLPFRVRGNSRQLSLAGEGVIRETIWKVMACRPGLLPRPRNWGLCVLPPEGLGTKRWFRLASWRLKEGTLYSEK